MLTVTYTLLSIQHRHTPSAEALVDIWQQLDRSGD